MKLESLSNDNFAPFKNNEVQNAFKIVGGNTVSTSLSGASDCIDYSTDKTASRDGGGRACDFYRDKTCLTAS